MERQERQSREPDTPAESADAMQLVPSRVANPGSGNHDQRKEHSGVLVLGGLASHERHAALVVDEQGRPTTGRFDEADIANDRPSDAGP